MESPFSLWLRNYSLPLDSRETREHLAAAAADFVEYLPFLPRHYERILLNLFVEGLLPVEDFIARLEARERQKNQ